MTARGRGHIEGGGVGADVLGKSAHTHHMLFASLANRTAHFNMQRWICGARSLRERGKTMSLRKSATERGVFGQGISRLPPPPLAPA